ncbi:hypothetical protein ES705_25684 [subsurface metagenome]
MDKLYTEMSLEQTKEYFGLPSGITLHFTGEMKGK